MLDLKGAYFYFLAKKINLIKIFKKFYFRTNFYKKTLISTTPENIYFYPNPFLLSSLINHKNFTFNVLDIDVDMFWSNQNSKKEERDLHNFLWLNLINRKNNALVIQKIITVWIYKNSKYKNIIWESSVLSRRIISWILNADIILNKTDNVFKNDFFQSVIIQTNHLKKNIKFENDYSKKIEAICAILLSGLVFKEYEENFNIGIKELKKLIENFFDKDGFPLNRNPSDLIKFSKYFILIKECIKDAQQFVPDFLDEIIEKNLSCIKSIITPSNQIPLFNGSTEVNIEKYLVYLDGLNYKLGKQVYEIGSLKILKNKKNYIFFDAGSPPKKGFSSHYQSGPLSFEYYFEGDKIITNCGFGSNISKKAILLSRLTSAQSTLTLNDCSVVKFERNKTVNSAFGNSIKNSFNVFEVDFLENENEIKTSATHDAYRKDFGVTCKRTIRMNKKDNCIYGCEELIQKREINSLFFNIRFHLNPDVTAVQTIGGKSVLIQARKKKSLIFTAAEQNLTLEKSIFLGGNKIINNLCITISGNLHSSEKKIYWELKKNI
ncbi:heparinase II/III family protein [Pelagibacteraceae bacterium]|nr:heparinase II/III family protein [Pelagibacteraceae bacterium]